MLHMASLLRGAAARAIFRDCSAIFLGVAELLERRVLKEKDGAIPQASPSAPPAPHPINITA